jgi:thioredoxin-related protein
MKPFGPAAPLTLTRRACLGALLLLAGARSAFAAEATLPAARSLRDELAAALKGGNPLVVMVSLPGCPFCAAVRQQYLVPMRDEERLPVVQVDMQSAQPVLDFNGAARTHEALIRLWNIPVAPTLLFFGRDGVEAAPRLAGAVSDYYGGYLDARLERARSAIKSR